MKSDLTDRRRRVKILRGHLKIDHSAIDPVEMARNKAEAEEIRRRVGEVHAAKTEEQRKAAEKGLQKILVGIYFADAEKVIV